MRSRLLNILFIGITMFSETTYLRDYDTSQSLAGFFLIIATMGIALGGYLDNDRSDVAIDRVNQKSRLVIGSRWIYFIYSLSFLTGLASLMIFDSELTKASAAIFCLLLGIPIILLHVYARFLSNYKTIGNVLIAFLCCLSLTMPGLSRDFVPPSYWSNLTPFLGLLFSAVYLREVVKDAEDLKGDQLLGRQTLPLLLGESFKFYVIALEFILMALVVCGYIFFEWPPWVILLLITYIILAKMVNWRRQDWRKMQILWKGFIGLGVMLRILTLHTPML